MFKKNYRPNDTLENDYKSTKGENSYPKGKAPQRDIEVDSSFTMIPISLKKNDSSVV